MREHKLWVLLYMSVQLHAIQDIKYYTADYRNTLISEAKFQTQFYESNFRNALHSVYLPVCAVQAQSVALVLVWEISVVHGCQN
jgi:hypothetical protein